MSNVQTDVDRTYLDPETRATASRYLQRTGNADIAVVLGLAEEVVENPLPKFCPACGKPVPSTGVCRRSRLCRVEARRLLGEEEP